MRILVPSGAFFVGTLSVAAFLNGEGQATRQELDRSSGQDIVRVAYAGPGHRGTASRYLSTPNQLPVPNDPLFPRQWHLRNTGQDGGAPDADIKALEAWSQEEGERSIIIAVVEPQPIDFDHPDLVGNRWSDLNDTTVHGWDFSECTEVPFETDALPGCGSPASSDSSGSHGTAAVGLAAAVGDNRTGVTGVCPRCKFMSVVLGARSTEESVNQFRRLAAFRYAAENGARIINASWNPPDTSFVRAVEALVEQHDIVVVVAAGNADHKVCQEQWLSSSESVIAVGASTDQDSRAPFSNKGPCLSVLAPGAIGTWSGIATTDVRGDAGTNNTSPPWQDCSELDDRDYSACYSGTSAAAPIVAGVVGLMLSADSSLTHDEVKAILELTADTIDSANAGYDDSGFSETHGYGRVNAGKAVRCVKNRASCPGSPP